MSENKEKPFFQKEVPCPVCGEVDRHFYLKDRMFIVEKQEEDSFISKYHWKNPGFNRYNLYNFYLWHCGYCKYTDDRGVFLKTLSSRTTTDGSLVKIYKKRYVADPLIALLSEHIKYPNSDYLSMLTLHLLAGYIQLMPELHQRNVEKIARLFHRTSWIFRMDQGDMEEEKKESLFNEYLKRYELLQGNYVNTLTSLEDIQQWVEQQMSIEKENGVSEWSQFDLQLQDLYATVTQQLDDMLIAIQEYSRVGIDYKKRFLFSSAKKVTAKFAEYESYLDFLAKASGFWPEIPMSESQAVARAIENYQIVIASRLLDGDKFKKFQVYRLIAYLNSRIENYNSAIEFSEQLIREARAFKNAAERRLKSAEVTKDERVNSLALNNYIKKSEEIIQNTQFRRDKFHEKLVEIDTLKARDIYTNNRDIAIDELKNLLQEASLLPEVVERFLEEKTNENKKGIFQIFKF